MSTHRLRVRARESQPRAAWALEQQGVPPLLARLFAARGVRDAAELNPELAQLHRPDQLKGIAKAADLLATAIQEQRRLCVVADYDCDGATACATLLRGLALLGAPSESLDYVVPDRAVHGYGLTPSIVDLALAQGADVLITVDNGIASLEGVAYAKGHGLVVIVTDHHLCAVDAAGLIQLPAADAIVNPNQPDCDFPSKALAGVGVAFYLLLALRAALRNRGVWSSGEQPKLDGLLDLVALGTVADVVRLDANNRRLVAQGLRRIRAGQMQPGLRALFQVAGRDARQASSQDFGFALGPRINAAGRLADMRLGIECLRTDDPQRAHDLALQLDHINGERRAVESQMQEQAQALLARVLPVGPPPPALALFDEAFHEGVVGILAGRLKDALHRPCFVFARGADGRIKGSGRSIPGFHLRDALDWVAKQEPELLAKFGGHAMAAGCTLQCGPEGVARLGAALMTVAEAWLTPPQLQRELLHDGGLAADELTLALTETLEQQVWGQGFEPPLFLDHFEVRDQRVVGSGHLKLRLRVPSGATEWDAMWFRRDDPLSTRHPRLAYRLSRNTYQGQTRLQLLIEAETD
ncbi:single-stranded-DNA-specific exonuclease RecJ [Inhella gelatinilytica]|uniref:Single-stranded-DNA-specific exonuclease RecJ n=1 Tax=Inhella gelatinilytica TaxID=2795030 RepID=A0A931NDX8_9BURK|nr:single-stranded-DNA-specific exonuclease RecJ [Inhella gelatinilytica]MBH9552695.1 single-stranded-DNA-specific exonuclease RecJ [Inhella gelatinilytica]